MNLATWAGIHSRVLNIVREEVNPDLPVQQWQVLCEIVNAPGIGSADLKNRLNMTGGSLTRNIKMLSQFYDRRTEETKGYDLIEAHIDTFERRARVYYLTSKGQQTMQRVYNRVQKLQKSTERLDVAI